MTRFPKRQELLRVGLVGLGNWGPNRLRVLVENEAVDVAYMCDLDTEKLARFSRRYPNVRPPPASSSCSRIPSSTPW